MRPNKDEYYLGIAKEISLRTTCHRVKIGAIIVRGDQIIAAGYIGSPRKTRDCLERGFCIRDKMNIPHGQRYELCRSVHAEMNAIINAARAGVSLFNGDMYVYAMDKDGNPINSFPCFFCKKLVINAGLKRVICSTKEGGQKTFEVSQWINDWQEADITDDRYQYGEDQNK